MGLRRSDFIDQIWRNPHVEIEHIDPVCLYGNQRNDENGPHDEQNDDQAQ